ncbi:hypothetical protein CVU37_11275 [candidate division BRC1 bacterium HGW-BRC1-1]|nr:MAG: hypothetical protein CVU37_11275 [candidate division BRC1 bacterium HGW-BRC1-1]
MLRKGGKETFFFSLQSFLYIRRDGLPGGRWCVTIGSDINRLSRSGFGGYRCRQGCYEKWGLKSFPGSLQCDEQSFVRDGTVPRSRNEIKNPAKQTMQGAGHEQDI